MNIRKILCTTLLAISLSSPLITYADGPSEVASKPHKGEVTLDKCNGTVEIIICNKKKMCKLIIIKKDKDTGKPIEEAEFVIKDKDGKVVFIGVTDKNGKIEIDLPCGKYYYEETRPADGYTLE